MSRWTHLARLFCAITFASGESWAEAPNAATISYDQHFFDALAPSTALDMVRAVPGFVINEGEERRGLAGAAGNVWIDGAAPTVKSDDIEDLLERIPAREVVRIELIRGSSGAMGAQTVRLNVVRRPSAGEGIWSAGLEDGGDGRISPSGQASWSGRRGLVEYRLTAQFEDARTPIRGEVMSFDASGALDEREFERIIESDRERSLSGEVSQPFVGGVMALSGMISTEDGSERQNVVDYDGFGALDGSELADAQSREDIGEFSVTYRRLFGVWESEWTALATQRRLSEEETLMKRDADRAFEEGAQEVRGVEVGEYILRGAAARAIRADSSLSLSAEVALNTFDQSLTLTEDDGSGPVFIALPAANVSIAEWRSELEATVAWRASPLWRFEAGAAYEISRLTQTGDAALTTDLMYFKPSFQAVRRLGDDDQVRLRLYRDVGQLNFEDYAATAELTGSVFAGNANLRPEASWRAEATVDWRFDGGALDLTAFHWRIEDALDFTPLGLPGDTFDARGNIGDATLSGLRASFEAPVPFLSHARLRVEGVWQRSEATDPLTGATRAQSEVRESYLAINFRQNVPAYAFAWGVEYERERIAPEYLFDRVSEEVEADELEIWAETRFSGLKLRVFAADSLNAGDIRDRLRFDPDRNGAADGAERRERRLQPVIGVELRGVF